MNARCFQLYHEIETEDHGYAMVRYGNGAVGIITASTASVGCSREMIEISGTNGTIEANYNEVIMRSIQQEPQILWSDRSEGTELIERVIADFLLAIEADRSPFVDGVSGSKASELAAEIYKKAQL